MPAVGHFQAQPEAHFQSKPPAEKSRQLFSHGGFLLEVEYSFLIVGVDFIH